MDSPYFDEAYFDPAYFDAEPPFDWAHAVSTVTVDTPAEATVTLSDPGSGVVTT